MMRQAGRYMKIYQDLCMRPGAITFRERSEAGGRCTLTPPDPH
jgi:hypothetical protein